MTSVAPTARVEVHPDTAAALIAEMCRRDLNIHISPERIANFVDKNFSRLSFLGHTIHDFRQSRRNKEAREAGQIP